MIDTNLEMTDKIGYLLFKKGIIDSTILEEALAAKANDKHKIKRNLAQILVEDFKYDHDRIFREVAILYAFRELETKPEEIPDERIESIRKMIEGASDSIKEMMIKHHVIPFMYDERIKDKLILASIDPTDRNMPRIAFGLNARQYEVIFIKKSDYEKLIKIILPPENEFLKAMEDDDDYFQVEESDENIVDEDELDSEINRSALINLCEAALIEAVRKGASDIHFIPRPGKKTEINMRIDGALHVWHVQENTLPEAVVAVVKDRGKGMDRFEREMGQDGFIQREIDGHIIRYRVSVLPVVGTEIKNKLSVVIRILDDRNVIRDLDKLGLVGYTKSTFVKAINQPQGMVILTGPTGSGKSTTLVAALYQVITPEVNVLTVEDPVEYVIEGARQLKIGVKMDFEQAIRSILRHDPDIVLVGEMRDKETAETAIKLANTGHLTFSTLHTNDAPSAVARLYKMGIEPFLIAYAINLIVAQRLIRKLCEKCKKKLSNFDEALMSAAGLDIAEWKTHTIYTPVGCDECNGSGYKGRMAIHEALYFTSEIRQLIVKSGVEVDEESIRIQARKDGSLNLRESALEKVKLGLSSMEEALGSTSDE
jgi:type IV pilus assembly protein PilB